MAKKLDYEYCPAAPVLEWFADKWMLVVLLRLTQADALRFNELYRLIPSISEKVLASTLHRLVDDGLVERTLYAEVPPRSEYRITPLGTDLMPHIMSLMEWGRVNFPMIMENRKKARRN